MTVQPSLVCGDPDLRAPFAPGGPFELDANRCNRLLATALRHGGTSADLYAEFGVDSALVLEDGIVETASRSVSLGVGVRVVRGDVAGYAYSEDLSWSALLRAAETAAQIANGTAGVPIDVTERHVPRRYAVDAPSVASDGLRKRDVLLQADRAARCNDTRITRVLASLHDSLHEVLVATSDGRLVRDVRPMLRFHIRVIAEADGKQQSGTSGGGGRLGMEYFQRPGKSAECHAREAVRVAIAMLDAREAPAGELDVVLAPGDAGVFLHEAVGHGLEADFSRKGVSNYSGRVDEQVASKLCTIVDTAEIPSGRGTLNVDDEGHEPTTTMLIERGVLRGYLHDTQSARHFRVHPTGNGRRESFRCVPLPRMTTTLLLAGPHGADEIVRSTKRGIYARRFGGGQVDIASGDFVFSLAEAYLIEDGTITAPVKGVNLIGNGPEVLGNVTMLGADLTISDGMWTCGKDGQSLPVGVGCPTLKIEKMTVGGTVVEEQG